MALKKAKMIMVTSVKGGTGKSTMVLNLAGIKLNAGGDAYAACLAVLYNPKSGSRTGAVGAVAAGVVCHRHRNLFCFAAGTVDVADAGSD